MKKQIIILTFILLLGGGNIVSASGISVSPGEVNIKGEVGKAKGKIIRVKNPTANVSLINVYPDEMEEIIRAIPSSFVLEAGKEREVIIEARPKEKGVAASTLSIRAEALSKEILEGAAGVKIPIRLEVSQASPYFASIAFAISKAGGWIALLVGLLVMAGILFGYGIKELKKS